MIFVHSQLHSAALQHSQLHSDMEKQIMDKHLWNNGYWGNVTQAVQIASMILCNGKNIFLKIIVPPSGILWMVKVHDLYGMFCPFVHLKLV